ncbi:MAG: glutathione S-transferase family protein [Geminicoccaceae bacterium]
MANRIRLHRHALSGHCHRVELFAGLAGLPIELVDVDLAKGEHQSEAFLSLNPLGQVPVIADGDIVLADSNAILVYLAKTYAPEWSPETPVQAAAVQRFLSIAAGELAAGPAAARLVTVFGAKLDHDRVKKLAARIFAVLDQDLAGRDWLVGDRPTIADVALYSYTAHAPEGQVGLDDYENIRNWLARLERLPGFVAMRESPVNAAD